MPRNDQSLPQHDAFWKYTYEKRSESLWANTGYVGRLTYIDNFIIPVLRKKKRILDLGCGSGNEVLHLLKQGVDAQGIDFSGSAIKKGRERLRSELGMSAKEAKERLLHLDMRDPLPLEGPYDIILAFGSLHCIEPKDDLSPYPGIHNAFREMRRLIADDGKIHLSVKSVDQPRRFLEVIKRPDFPYGGPTVVIKAEGRWYGLKWHLFSLKELFFLAGRFDLRVVAAKKRTLHHPKVGEFKKSNNWYLTLRPLKKRRWFFQSWIYRSMVLIHTPVHRYFALRRRRGLDGRRARYQPGKRHEP